MIGISASAWLARIRASLALTALLAVAVGGAAPAHAMTAVPYGQIVATHSGKCINVQGAPPARGSLVSALECGGAPGEQWQLLPTATAGYFQLSVQGSGLCLAIPRTLAAQIVLLPCDNDAFEGWRPRAQTAGGYILQSQETGECLDFEGAGQTDLTRLIHYSCNGGQNQLFQFEQPAFVANAPVAITSQLSGQCIGVQNGSAQVAAYTVQYPCATAAETVWAFYPVGAGLVAVVNPVTGMCLDVFGASTQAGAPTDQYYCTGNTNQQWKLQAAGNAWQLVAQNSGLCLGVNGSLLTAGTPLITAPCSLGAVVQWTFHVPAPKAVWAAPVAENSVAVAAANLPNGKILTWAADYPDNFQYNPLTYTEVIDPITGADTQYIVTNTAYNMFCPGIANLPDGRILVNGGDTSGDTALYNPATNQWTSDAPMNYGRGYEGTVLNADGSVLTLGGSWRTTGEPAGATPGELWRAGAGWTLLSNMPSKPAWTNDANGPYRADNHMWLHVLSGGRLLQAGPSATMHWLDPRGDNGLGTIVSAGARGDGDSMNGNASAFDVDKLLTVGGAPNYDNSPATPNAVLIDGSGAGNPAVTTLAPMNYARGFANSVVLPNGQVVVVGGQTFDEPFTDTNAVLVPEIWDPATRIFSTLPPMATARTYHSTALLLPDGRVWVSGGGLCGGGCGSVGANHLTYEILTPPYLLTARGTPAARPVIAAVSATTLKAGGALKVLMQSPVKTFALMRLSSVTHTVNNDQRRIPLAATTPDGALYSTVLPADRSVLMPGYYMLFALDARGVPSQSVTLLIQ